MKPKDLRYPYRWNDRCPLYKDDVFYVPDYYHDHASWEGKFPLSSRMNIEFCSGNGEWILGKALENPEIVWVGVEKDFERVRKIVAKRTNLGVKNLLVVSGLAEPFVENYLPDSVIDEVYVNFPDPWPKDRHAKHRLFKQPFIGQMKRIMKKGALATLVTDDATYAGQMETEMGREFALKTKEPITGYGSSFFERLWRDKGRDIHFLRYTC
ncbi:MAG: tRNA (guanine-N(7)-)-methyltransferase [Chlamydiia bacterium]|nr:tRNA (guanine-N(7)-)-methyltransferase [Chlamydiia bacterium]MCH9615576.1 tRNA (guanine-N(7)-)-methyltransferase [Chlamydiia bacterium]MCH9629231.1 tRNA (guanine-N(7)-)-methyltransferase [Chlamydiia bacterium]